MQDAVAQAKLPPVLADAAAGEAFAAIANPDSESSPGRNAWHAIAAKIGRHRRPGAPLRHPCRVHLPRAVRGT